jgi:hypothetical protein
MQNNNLQKVIDHYIEAAIKYGDGINIGDGKLSDNGFDEVQRLFIDIKSFEDEGLERIAGLLQHKNESVRLWAATHLLNYPRFDSMAILNALQASTSILGLTAKITIDLWEKGELKY